MCDYLKNVGFNEDDFEPVSVKPGASKRDPALQTKAGLIQCLSSNKKERPCAGQYSFILFPFQVRWTDLSVLRALLCVDQVKEAVREKVREFTN